LRRMGDNVSTCSLCIAHRSAEPNLSVDGDLFFRTWQCRHPARCVQCRRWSVDARQEPPVMRARCRRPEHVRGRRPTRIRRIRKLVLPRIAPSGGRATQGWDAPSARAQGPSYIEEMRGNSSHGAISRTLHARGVSDCGDDAMARREAGPSIARSLGERTAIDAGTLWPLVQMKRRALNDEPLSSTVLHQHTLTMGTRVLHCHAAA